MKKKTKKYNKHILKIGIFLLLIIILNYSFHQDKSVNLKPSFEEVMRHQLSPSSADKFSDPTSTYIFTYQNHKFKLPKFKGKLIEKLADKHQLELPSGKINEYEEYSPLDKLGRTQAANALLGPNLLPKTKRTSISHIKPSGWQQKKYKFIKGEVLYNRSHLIAHSLAGENDNPLNLITGTYDLNQLAMTRYEEHVLSYIKSTGKKVYYVVIPIYIGDDLVARGIIMDAHSTEDEGKSISFSIFIHNVQRGVKINYSDGKSKIAPFYEDYYDFDKDIPRKFS